MEFELDLNPTVLNLTPSLNTIRFGDESFSLTIDFSEAMNTEVNPTVSFPNEDPSSVIQFRKGNWEDNDTYTAIYDVKFNGGYFLSGIDVQIAGAEDLEHKVLDETLKVDQFSIDTMLMYPLFPFPMPSKPSDTVSPKVVEITPNLTTITKSNIGEGTFSLKIDFSEAMDQEREPYIYFEGVSHEAIHFAGGKWQDSNTYIASYDVLSVEDTLRDIDVRVMEAMDVAGNYLKSGYGEDLFSIEATEAVFFNVQYSFQATSTVSQTAATLEVGGLQLGSFFDEGFYLKQNQDVAAAIKAGQFATGYDHFVSHGIKEGRNPNALFDETYYLENNADVKAGIEKGWFDSGLEHFLLVGHKENRDPSALFDADDYLLKNPDVKAGVEKGWFDSGFEHMLGLGILEGRVGFSFYQEKYYLENNADVKAGVEKGWFESGWQHFQLVGMSEGRNPSANFNNDAYLNAHSDVAAAVKEGWVASGVAHFVFVGQYEGRTLG